MGVNRSTLVQPKNLHSSFHRNLTDRSTVSKCGGMNRGEREENSNTGESLLAVLLRLCLSSKTRSSNEKPRMDGKNRPSSLPVVNAIVNHCIFQWFRFAFRLARNVRAWFRAGGYPGWNPINRKRLFVRMKKSLPRARPLINPDGSYHKPRYVKTEMAWIQYPDFELRRHMRLAAHHRHKDTVLCSLDHAFTISFYLCFILSLSLSLIFTKRSPSLLPHHSPSPVRTMILWCVTKLERLSEDRFDF